MFQHIVMKSDWCKVDNNRHVFLEYIGCLLFEYPAPEISGMQVALKQMNFPSDF